MRIFISGGSGFIGIELIEYLNSLGHQLTVIGRSSRPPHLAGIAWIQADPTSPGPWQDKLREHEAVINLAGASIFCRWNATNRRKILDSRILTTGNIIKALKAPGHRVKTILSGSAVGFYGDPGETEVDESSAPGKGFLAEVCTAWEAEALTAEEYDIRVVRCRFGVVLGSGGGALAQMLPVFKAGFGAELGSGRQWFPWIHLHDLVRIISLLLSDQGISGAVNLVAPEQVTNKDLTRALASTLHKPLVLPAVPAWILRLVQGEASTLLLNSLKVRPQVLLQAGFVYDFPALAMALDDLLRTRSAAI